MRVPSWYDLSIDRSSSESVLEAASVPKFMKPAGCKITSHSWDGAARIMAIKYECPEKIYTSNFGYPIALEITKFKTPVNQYVRKGFRLTTTDYHGHVIDKSRDNQALVQTMSVLGKFSQAEIQLNGDRNRENAGRISLYNSVTLFLSSDIPFQ